MSSNQIVIEKIKNEDLDEIVRLGLATPEVQVGNNKQAYYYTKEELLPFIQSPDGICLVAKVDGNFAGYRLANYNPYLKEAYLMDLVVKPEFQRLGVASLLYQKTFDILKQKGCDWVWVLVKQGNKKMEHFLEKQKYKKGAKFTFFYKVKPF